MLFELSMTTVLRETPESVVVCACQAYACMCAQRKEYSEIKKRRRKKFTAGQ